jgi:hypothetical protein
VSSATTHGGFGKVRKATEMPFNLILEAVPGAGALYSPAQDLGRLRCRALALIGDARAAIETSDSSPCNDNPADPFTSARVLAGMRKYRPFVENLQNGSIRPIAAVPDWSHERANCAKSGYSSTASRMGQANAKPWLT